MLKTIVLFFVGVLASASWADKYFLADGGTFATLDIAGRSVKFHLSPTSGNEPAFDQADLGTFSLADHDWIEITGFENNTYEDGGSAVFGGKLAHRVYRSGDTPGPFSTNHSTLYMSLGIGLERHYETNLHLNVFTNLGPGEYRLEVFALAAGNFSPDMEQNNNGSNYIARFTLISTPRAVPSEATPNGKMRLNFEYTVDAGYGNEVYVVGNHPDLGYWNPLDARKLYWTAGNRWTGQVAVTENSNLEYKYIIRTNQNSDFANPVNVIWMPGPNLRTNTPALPGRPYDGKTLYYYSTWTNATLIYQCDPDTNWYAQAMTRLGDGRRAGESLYRMSGFGKSGEQFEFVPSGYYANTQYWDHTPIPGQDNYYTRLDVALLQDGNIYNYWPPTNTPVSRIETTFIASSWTPAVSSRTVRIYLPRHYDVNATKRYPVLYMHDGQNDFRPGGMFGCWYAEDAADHMISLGLMRESIVVAVDNTGSRSREYVPPGDTAGAGDGFADQYRNYLIQNVKAYVDANYRTLPDRDNTAVAGSSLGGIVSLYIGLTTNAFSKLGCFSTHFPAGTNFVNTYVRDGTVSAVRVYFDAGTLENNDYYWRPMWETYNYFLIDGYADNDGIVVAAGIGHNHNEAAWAARAPAAFSYLLDARDEGNALAALLAPPELTIISNPSMTMTLRHIALKNVPYCAQISASLLSDTWIALQTNLYETVPWRSVDTTLNAISPTSGIIRLQTVER